MVINFGSVFNLSNSEQTMKQTISIPKKSLKRLAHYHYYLKQLEKKRRDFVSIERLANDLALTQNEVREDIANLNEQLGINDVHNVAMLTELIEQFLGYNRVNAAILVGVGNLGRSLLNYNGFRVCGLEIQAVFDNNPNTIGTHVAGMKVLPIEQLPDMIKRLNIKVGIITTPPEPAQAIANTMIDSGVIGIWNFSLEILKTPEHVVIQSSSLYSDFLKLSHKMKENNESHSDE